MQYQTIALRDLIKKHEKDAAKKVLSDFLCPKNKDVENFMHEQAYAFKTNGMARTHLIIAIDNEKSYGVCAVFPITTRSIPTDPKMDKKTRRLVFGTTYAVGKNVNAILIGQLSKNYTHGNDKYITGEVLMSLIIENIKEVDEYVPSVYVYVGCEDIKELRSYYERHAFTHFSNNSDELLQYIIPTKKFISPEYKKTYIKQKMPA